MSLARPSVSEVVGSIPGRGQLVSIKDTSMSLSDWVKLVTSKFDLEPRSSTFCASIAQLAERGARIARSLVQILLEANFSQYDRLHLL